MNVLRSRIASQAVATESYPGEANDQTTLLSEQEVECGDLLIEQTKERKKLLSDQGEERKSLLDHQTEQRKDLLDDQREDRENMQIASDRAPVTTAFLRVGEKYPELGKARQ